MYSVPLCKIILNEFISTNLLHDICGSVKKTFPSFQISRAVSAYNSVRLQIGIYQIVMTTRMYVTSLGSTGKYECGAQRKKK
jgi:hypothetical protein